MNAFGKLNFSVSFDPTSAFPIDARTVFDTYEEASAAASTATEIGSTNSKYFYGMTLTVGTKKFVIQTDGTLVELLQAVPIVKEIPNSPILPNVLYMPGTITGGNISFPNTANIGDMCYVSFQTETDFDSISVDFSNTVGISDFALGANTVYEFSGIFNGNYWILLLNEVIVT